VACGFEKLLRAAWKSEGMATCDFETSIHCGLKIRGQVDSFTTAASAADFQV